MKEIELIRRLVPQDGEQASEDVWSLGEMPDALADLFYRTLARRISKHWWKESLFRPIRPPEKRGA
jgi:hypothetical protein